MTRRLRWFGAAACMAAVCLSASIALARQGILKTKDGRTLEGNIDEKPDVVSVNIRGILTKVDRENVASIDYFDNVEARYKDLAAKLPKNATAKDHLDLARWLFDVKSYDLALREVDAAKRADPNSAEAATLEQTIMSQRRIDRLKPPGGGGPAVPPKPGPGPAVPPAAGAGTGTTPAAHPEAKYLTPQDINIIRQMEWRKNDTLPPRVTVPPDVRKRYVDFKAIPASEFAALTPVQQAYEILTDQAAPAELKRDVKITSDPTAIAEFRRQVQPQVINSCATVNCHGGSKAGRFVLFHNNIDRDEVAYTNFYILQTYRQRLGDRDYLMVDRTYPEQSILSHFALPPDQSDVDHPEIKGQPYKAMVPGRSAPGYRALVNWMGSLRAGDPEYGIRYTPPGAAKPAGDKPAGDKPAGDKPAGAPATGAAPAAGTGTAAPKPGPAAPAPSPAPSPSPAPAPVPNK